MDHRGSRWVAPVNPGSDFLVHRSSFSWLTSPQHHRPMTLTDMVTGFFCAIVSSNDRNVWSEPPATSLDRIPANILQAVKDFITKSSYGDVGAREVEQLLVEYMHNLHRINHRVFTDSNEE